MIFVYIFFIMAIITIDQSTKYFALKIFETHPYGVYVTDFFTLLLTWNDGLMLNIANGEKHFIIGITLTTTLICLIFIVSSKSIMEKLAYTCIAGGGFANLIDRFSHQAVADFFYFHYKDFHFPIFNIADMFIVLGIMLFIIHFIVPNSNKENLSHDQYY